MKTLYDVLGARPDDEAEVLKRAYRSAALANLPDHHAGDPEAAMRFKQITAAYEILRDARLRAAYDRRLEGQRRQQQLERQRRRPPSKLKHTVSEISHFIANAIAATAVTVLLIGGYILFVRPTRTAVGDATNVAAREYAAKPGPQHGAPAPVAAPQTVMVVRSDVSTAAANGSGERRPATSKPGANPARLTPEEVCQRDAVQLARLRINQSRDEVLEFEQELGCEKLRPQVIRLRESVAELGPPRDTPPPEAAPQAPAIAVRPDVSTAPQMPVMPDVSTAAANDGVERQPATPRPAGELDPLEEEVCKRDAAQLARLRISQSHDEVLEFEQELGCEKLRPQVLRLRESVAPQ
jgi:hypothetical protein